MCAGTKFDFRINESCNINEELQPIFGSSMHFGGFSIFQFFFSSSAMRGIEMPQEEGELNEGETASIIGRFGLPLIEFHSMRALEQRRGEPISQIQDLTIFTF